MDRMIRFFSLFILCVFPVSIYAIYVDGGAGGVDILVSAAPHEQSPTFHVFEASTGAIYDGDAVTHINFRFIVDGGLQSVGSYTYTMNPDKVLAGVDVLIQVRIKMEPVVGDPYWVTVNSDPIPYNSAPDPCGPLAFSTTIQNTTDFAGVFAVVEHKPEGDEILDSFNLGPLSQIDVNVEYDEICNNVSIVQITDGGTGPSIIHETYSPDAPDPPDLPESDDGTNPPQQTDLDFEETPLYDIASDLETTDIEKEIESDYYLWKREDDRQAEIIEVLEEIRDGEGTGTGSGNKTEETLLERLDELEETKPEVGDMQAAGQDAANDHASKIPTLDYSGSFNGGSAPAWNLSIKGMTFNMNPFQFSEIQSLASWVRAGFAFFFILSFATWAHKESTTYLQALPQIQQARGNTFGGTGGQVTALIAAGLMTVAIGIAIVALMTWVTYDFGLGDVTSIMGVNPFNGSGSVANGVWMLDQFIPLGGFVASLVGRIVWKLTADTAFVIVASVIRFIVP